MGRIIEVTGAPLQPGKKVTAALFSPDGRRVLTVATAQAGSSRGAASELRLWDALTRRPLTAPLKHRDAVVSTAFSPDGRRLLAAGKQETRLWDVETGTLLTLPLSYPLDGQVAFSADGRRLLVTAGNQLRCQDLSPGEDPVDDLVLLAQLLSGRQIDGTGSLAPLDAADLDHHKQTLGVRFAPSAAERLAWHRREAAACETVKDWPGALRHLERLIAAEPAQAALFYRRGEAHAQLGEWEQSAADHFRALQIQPEYAPAWQELAFAHATWKQWDRTVADYTALIESKPAAAWAWQAWFYRGLAQRNLHQPDRAVADLTEVVNRQPGDDEVLEARYYRGRTYAELRQWDPALKDYAELAKKYPNAGELLYHRGVAYAGKGDWEKAGADLTRAQTSRRLSETTWYPHLMVRLALKDQEGYRKGCAAVLHDYRGGEGKREVTSLAAWICCLAPDAVTDYEPVVRLAKTAAAKEPRNAVCARTLGAALYRAGQWTEAEPQLRQALALPQSDLAAGFLLAMTQHRLGRAAAKETLAQALQAAAQAGDLDWDRRLELELLRKEAESLLKGGNP